LSSDGLIEPLPKSKLCALWLSDVDVDAELDTEEAFELVPGWAARATRAKTAKPVTATAAIE
jgi:hypothetical protein